MPMVMSKEEMQFYLHKPPSTEYSLSHIAKSMQNIERLLEIICEVFKSQTEDDGKTEIRPSLPDSSWEPLSKGGYK